MEEIRHTGIDVGARVVTRDGEKAGSIVYVVVQPPEMHMTNIVVSTGALLGRDVVVPVDAVDRVVEGTVHLSINRDELDRQPDYVDVEFQQPPEDWFASSNFGYPAMSALWPAGTYVPRTDIASIKVNAPPGTVALHEGMDVHSSDGHRIGTVQALETDPVDGDIVAFEVKRGMLFSHETRVPLACVEGVDDQGVRLNITEEEARQRLPEN